MLPHVKSKWRNSLTSQCFVTEPEFDHTSSNHSYADLFIFNDCILIEYNAVFGANHSISALGYWNETEVEDYVATVTNDSSSRRLENSNRLLRKKTKKGSGGSGACRNYCGDELHSDISKRRRLRGIKDEDGNSGRALSEASLLDIAVTQCLQSFKDEGYLEFFDIPNGITIMTCVDALTGDDTE